MSAGIVDFDELRRPQMGTRRSRIKRLPNTRWSKWKLALRITSERAEECMKAVSVEGAAVLEIWHKFETKWRMKMEWRKTTEEEEAEEEEEEEEEEEKKEDV